MSFFILVINPGSTSTKLAIYEDETLRFEKSIYHDLSVLRSFPTILSQLDFRKELILNYLFEINFDLKSLAAIACRGGMLLPVESGCYLINDLMVNHMKNAIRGEHASNLATIIGSELSTILNIPAYTVDPVSVDEMEEIARISGIPGIVRESFFHALNHKATARRVSKDLGVAYKDLNLIIAHLGGGISVAVHKNARVIDVNESLEGDGPMSPERSGTVPLGQLYRMCFSGDYKLEEIVKMNHGKGGLCGYLGTNDSREVVERIKNGDTQAELIYNAMIYQIAKEIGSASTVLNGDVDYIVLTGGLAYENYLVTRLVERVKFISKVLVYPGENEMNSLACGVLRILNNEEIVKTYDGGKN